MNERINRDVTNRINIKTGSALLIHSCDQRQARVTFIEELITDIETIHKLPTQHLPTKPKGFWTCVCSQVHSSRGSLDSFRSPRISGTAGWTVMRLALKLQAWNHSLLHRFRARRGRRWVQQLCWRRRRRSIARVCILVSTVSWSDLLYVAFPQSLWEEPWPEDGGFPVVWRLSLGPIEEFCRSYDYNVTHKLACQLCTHEVLLRL